MTAPNASRNLLFGVLAVQMGFCRSDQLVSAMQDWLRERSLSLDEILVKLDILTPRRRELLVQAVDEHLVLHGPVSELSVEAVQTGAQQRSQATQQFLEEGGRRLVELSEALPNELAETEPIPGGFQAASAAAQEPVPAVGGRFRVLGLHARGGMGQVMLAEDQQLRRRVALKEIQPDLSDDPARRERFLAEAEITGGLEHPGIVPVYALGTYPDGRPYYAMRLIRGDDFATAIDEFHRRGSSGLDAGRRTVELQRLLRRFSDVCQAVQYAHSRGVLHRDLKPGNVMLGKYGETLVVDWGLAKLIDRPEAGKAAEESTLRLSGTSGSYATLMGSVVGTPGYMSPEQAAGKLDELGPASDVYSLGAMLYCLLTGRAPFQAKTGVIERVKAGDFPPPRMVHPQVPKPLEAICLKAMALAPQDRYASPGGIVEDLEHWLADEPVTVYRETWSERLARWTRRHRTWFQAAILSLAVIAVVSATAAILVLRAWQREATAWGEAEGRFVQAREAVDKWLTGVSEALRYYPLLARTREALLERAAEDYERFVQQTGDDGELTLERGRTYLRLGHLRHTLRDSRAAEKSYTEARGLFASLPTAHPHFRDGQVELANADTDLGLLAAETGQVSQADEFYRAAIVRLHMLLDAAADSIPVRQALAAALLNRGELLAETGRHDEAERELRRCLDLLTTLSIDLFKIVKADDAARDEVPQRIDQHEADRMLQQLRVTEASAGDLLGRSLLDQGRYEEAAAAMNAAVRLATQLVEQRPDHPPYLESRAASQIYLASVLRVLGRWDEEAQAYRQAAEDYAALCGALPGVALFEESLAITRMDHGNLLVKLGRVGEAKAELNQACAVLEDLMQAHPEFPRYRDEWACCCLNLGELLQDRGEYGLAKSLIQGAVAAFETLIEDGRGDAGREVVKYAESLALCHNQLGQLLHTRDQDAEAEQAFAAAIAGLSSLPVKSPASQDRLAFVHQQRGMLLADMGKEAESLAEFLKAKELRQQLTAAPGAAAEHRANLAWLLILCPHAALRDPQEAVRLARTLTAEVPRNADYQNLLGAALYRSGDYQGALPRIQEASRLRGSEHARDAFWLALAHGKSGQAEAAKQAYDRGERWLAGNLPHNPELRRLQREAAESLGIPVSKPAASLLVPQP